MNSAASDLQFVHLNLMILTMMMMTIMITLWLSAAVALPFCMHATLFQDNLEKVLIRGGLTVQTIKHVFVHKPPDKSQTRYLQFFLH